MELLRFTTAGSVDDGKSTLIGRLLYETASVKQDILASVSGDTDEINLAFLTDGLRAEREQGITIDVAYKYFSTRERAFIITDAPGHFRYTRNLVSGASNVDLMIILVDAVHGITDQTRIHSQVASFLRAPSVLVAVNKMDLVHYGEERFEQIRHTFLQEAQKLQLGNIAFIPISALEGDNISSSSAHMPWYTGPALLQYLETLPVSKPAGNPLRISVQGVIAGTVLGKIVSGTLMRGDTVAVYPGGTTAKVERLMQNGAVAEEASEGQHIAIALAGASPLTRGDMLVHPGSPSRCDNVFSADLCWLDDVKTAEVDHVYVLRIGCREISARISRIESVLHPVTHEWSDGIGTVSVNQFARVRILADEPLAFDDFTSIRSTGRGILIDPQTNAVLAAMVITSG